MIVAVESKDEKILERVLNTILKRYNKKIVRGGIGGNPEKKRV
jgi:hypothetical protein